MNGALERLAADAEALALQYPDDADLKTALLERVSKEHQEVEKKKPKTVHAYYEDFLKYKEMHTAENTVKVFRTLQKHMRKHLPAEMTPADIRPATMAGFQSGLLSGGMNNNSANKYAARLRSFFLWLEENEVIGSAPKYKALKTLKSDVLRLTLEELAALRALDLSASPDGHAAARDLFLFSAYTGLRFGDCTALAWDQVGKDALFLHEEKTGNFRRIPITAAAREIVERRRGAEAPLPRLSNQKANEYLKVIASEAGIDAPVTLTTRKGGKVESETVPKHEAISMHAGRRTFISLMLESGVSTKEMLGITHTDLRSLQRYAAASEDHLRQNMERTFDLSPARESK